LNAGVFDEAFIDEFVGPGEAIPAPYTPEDRVNVICHALYVLRLCIDYRFSQFHLETRTQIGILEDYIGDMDRGKLLDVHSGLHLTIGRRMVEMVVVEQSVAFACDASYKILLELGIFGCMYGIEELASEMFTGMMALGAVGGCRVLAREAATAGMTLVYDILGMLGRFGCQRGGECGDELCAGCVGRVQRGHRVVRDCVYCVKFRAAKKLVADAERAWMDKRRIEILALCKLGAFLFWGNGVVASDELTQERIDTICEALDEKSELLGSKSGAEGRRECGNVTLVELADRLKEAAMIGVDCRELVEQYNATLVDTTNVWAVVRRDGGADGRASVDGVGVAALLRSTATELSSVRNHEASGGEDEVIGAYDLIVRIVRV
jgi:hypothetical protein